MASPPEQSEERELRILVVGGRPHAVQVLRQVFDMLGIRLVRTVTELSVAIELLRSHSFDVVFCDEYVGETEANEFVRAARRTPGLVNPMVAIFLVCAGPRKREVEAARDLGFNDVLTRPLSAATVRRKINAALRKPRAFIVAGEFFGPDRRSGPRPWPGRDRRKRQPRKVKFGVAADSDWVAE